MPKTKMRRAEDVLLKFGHMFPEVTEEYPWDHTVLKVRKKTFVFFGGKASPDDRLSVTVKLPMSGEMALTLPHVTPASHGLGKSGWVHLVQTEGEEVDVEMIKGWIEQSYRAVAPKKLIKTLDEEK